MKLRALAILLVIVLLLIPVYYLLQVLKRWVRPRESAARMFLYFMGAFLLVIAYTLFLVGLVVKLFPPR